MTPATSRQQTETLLITILVQLIVMICAARLMNLLFRRCGQPARQQLPGILANTRALLELIVFHIHA